MDSVILPELPTYLFAPNLAGVLSLAVTFLLPLVAALFMRTSWSAFRKGLVLLLVSAVKTFLEAWLVAVEAEGAFHVGETAYAVVVNFGLAVVFYAGLLRNTSVQQAVISRGPVKEQATAG
ncbi:hypothetical protein D7147_10450 [Micromonospora musae]|uniref:Uncharacterized protein n=1 Tax=Micromonospora musae TaxID=1894970 RepID=A0A3A9YNN2_9ACTN|nr:hypothetical protein [Micromonospora musae]RKN21194.1 hypothetical protein D7147_10450 [Micromonospora musae]RKN36466.1 hypothetical protein D7044_02140 [Micromonospora musae]